MQNKENIRLLQILEQGDVHLQKIDEMVIRQKTELAIDITNLQEKIMVVIQSIKEENMKRLDSFNEKYKQSFITLKANIDQFFLLSRQNFYYSNQNTFQYKLASLGTPEAQQFLSNQKNHLNKSKQLSQGNVTPLQMLTDLQTLARFLLQMTNSSPNYDKLQNPQTNILDSVVNEVGFVLNNVVLARLYIPFGSNKELSQVQTGQNNLQLQMAARNIENQSLLKSSQQELKQLVYYQFEITYLQLVHKMTVNQGYLIHHKKKYRHFQVTIKIQFILFVPARLIADSLCLWVWTNNQFWIIDNILISTQPRVFRKIQLSQMPNNQIQRITLTQHLRYQYLQFLHSKDWNKQHQIFEQDQWIDSLKEGRKNYFIFFRFNYKHSENYEVCSSQDPVLICDQNLYDPLYGSISQIFITTQWPGHCVIVPNEDTVKLFDFNKNCIVFSKFRNRKISSTLMENVLIEVSDQKINPQIWLIAFSFNDNVATQHHLGMSLYAMMYELKGI